MRIGIDIDGTITDTDVIYRKIISTKFNIQTDESVYELFDDLNDRQKTWIYKHNNEIITNFVKPLPDSVEVIKELTKDGHAIFFITARDFQKSSDATFEWFKTNGLDSKNIIFDSHDKLSDCLNLNIELMIEDCPKHLDALYKQVKTMKFDHAYNKNTKSDYHSDNWKDIYAQIKGM